MYYFEARYYDIDNDKEITRKIVFDGQFLTKEKNAYIYAIDKAYDMKAENELLVSLEFIAC